MRVVADEATPRSAESPTVLTTGGALCVYSGPPLGRPNDKPGTNEARLAPAIKGYTFLTGAAVTVHIPYAVVLVAAVEVACIVVGALIGVGVVLCRMVGERRGN